ncbi:DUF397 domain-containing protein [Lentzea sp. NPDC051213]|uniref:DUF397 domain-containing protein n=1 Tax=Lentzea sp. NPDC051213 TaxID=3364126 RepID=UPI0037AB98DD
MTEWRKSSYTANSAECVEVGPGVGIRDSKDPGPHMEIGPSAWSAFLSATKADKLAR